MSEGKFPGPNSWGHCRRVMERIRTPGARTMLMWLRRTSKDLELLRKFCRWGQQMWPRLTVEASGKGRGEAVWFVLMALIPVPSRQRCGPLEMPTLSLLFFVLLSSASNFHPLPLPPRAGMECVLSLRATLTLSPIFLSFKARAVNCDFSSPGAKEIAPCKCLPVSGPRPPGWLQSLSVEFALMRLK